METGVTNFLLENLGLVGVIIISLVCVILFLWREIKNGNKKQLDAQEKLTSELTNSIANNFSQLTQQLTSTLSSQNEKLLDIVQTFITKIYFFFCEFDFINFNSIHNFTSESQIRFQ